MTLLSAGPAPLISDDTWEARRDANRVGGRFGPQANKTRAENIVSDRLHFPDYRDAIAAIDEDAMTYDLVEVRPDDVFTAEQVAWYVAGDFEALNTSVAAMYRSQSDEWAADAALDACEQVNVDFRSLDVDAQEQVLAAIWAKDVSDPVPQLLANTRRRALER